MSSVSRRAAVLLGGCAGAARVLIGEFEEERVQRRSRPSLPASSGATPTCAFRVSRRLPTRSTSARRTPPRPRRRRRPVWTRAPAYMDRAPSAPFRPLAPRLENRLPRSREDPPDHLDDNLHATGRFIDVTASPPAKDARTSCSWKRSWRSGDQSSRGSFRPPDATWGRAQFGTFRARRTRCGPTSSIRTRGFCRSPNRPPTAAWRATTTGTGTTTLPLQRAWFMFSGTCDGTFEDVTERGAGRGDWRTRGALIVDLTATATVRFTSQPPNVLYRNNGDGRSPT